MNYVEREVEKNMLKLLPVCLVSFREEIKCSWNIHTEKCMVDKCFMLGWVSLKWGGNLYLYHTKYPNHLWKRNFFTNKMVLTTKKVLLKTILYFFPLGYLVMFITLYTILLVFIAVIPKLTLGAKGYNETQKRNIYDSRQNFSTKKRI